MAMSDGKTSLAAAAFNHAGEARCPNHRCRANTISNEGSTTTVVGGKVGHDWDMGDFERCYRITAL